MKRLVVLVAAVLGAGLLLAAPALAHVSIDAPGATQGGDAVLRINVPNESDKASTTRVQLALPTDAPIASVLVQAIPGWTFTTTTTKLAKPITTDDGTVTEAVSEIDWKATGGGIAPGQFQQFVVDAGSLPDTSTLVLPAIQTYSDGTVVKWIERAAPGSTSEPAHPPPALSLAPASGRAAPVAAASSAAPTPAKSSTTGATALSIVSLALAAAALGTAVVVRAQVRGTRR